MRTSRPALPSTSNLTTREKASSWDTLSPLFKAMYREFQELSKKKPDGAVSTTKIKMVNRLLNPIHELLADEPNFKFIDKLDEDDLPQNSDVVLVMSQIDAAMAAFRQKYHRSYHWQVPEDET